MLYFLLRYIIRYRLDVVRDNINRVFPDKSDKEKEVIVNNFFHHFCQQSLESIHFLFMSEKTIKKKFVFENIDLLEKFADEGKNITVVLGHYGNWDGLASTPLWTDKLTAATLYKRIRNEYFNNLFLKIRSRFGTRCIEKKQALRGIIALNKEEKRNVIAYLADQTPSGHNIHYWINFLGQPTPVLSGWAAIAQKFNTPVVYVLIKPIKRGYYTVHLETITDDPKSMTQIELIKQFMGRLEKDILEAPEFWLWSHRRWKFQLPEGTKIL